MKKEITVYPSNRIIWVMMALYEMMIGIYTYDILQSTRQCVRG